MYKYTYCTIWSVSMIKHTYSRLSHKTSTHMVFLCGIDRVVAEKNFANSPNFRQLHAEHCWNICEYHLNSIDICTYILVFVNIFHLSTVYNIYITIFTMYDLSLHNDIYKQTHTYHLVGSQRPANSTPQSLPPSPWTNRPKSRSPNGGGFFRPTNQCSS